MFQEVCLYRPCAEDKFNGNAAAGRSPAKVVDNGDKYGSGVGGDSKTAEQKAHK